MSVELKNIDFRINVENLEFFNFYIDMQEKSNAAGYNCYMIDKDSDHVILTFEPIDTECITLYNLMRLIEKIRKNYIK
jgi:hypothetical protein